MTESPTTFGNHKRVDFQVNITNPDQNSFIRSLENIESQYLTWLMNNNSTMKEDVNAVYWQLEEDFGENQLLLKHRDDIAKFNIVDNVQKQFSNEFEEVSGCMSNFSSSTIESLNQGLTKYRLTLWTTRNVPKGGTDNKARTERNNKTMSDRRKNSSSYLVIHNDDNRCMIRACYLAIMWESAKTKVEKDKVSKRARNKVKSFTTDIINWCKKNNFVKGIKDKQLSHNDIKDMSRLFQRNILLWTTSTYEIIRTCYYDREDTRYIHLVYNDQLKHYDLLKNPNTEIKSYFPGRQACYYCALVFTKAGQEDHYGTCKHFKKLLGEKDFKKREICRICNKPKAKTKKHVCYITCPDCFERIDFQDLDEEQAKQECENHKCYLRPNSKYIQITPTSKYIYYDFECLQDSKGQHIPNLIIAQYGSQKELNKYQAEHKLPVTKENVQLIWATEKYTQETLNSFKAQGDIVFQSSDITKDFVRWCCLKVNNKKKIYAHNAAKYDSILIKNALLTLEKSDNIKTDAKMTGKKSSQFMRMQMGAKYNFVIVIDLFLWLWVPSIKHLD
jgi:predicted RNA-binding protein YlxR (DUF448 family)